MVNWGGRCCTCSEWGRRARIAFLTSNRSLLGRSIGGAKLSLPHHRAITPAVISPATITPPRGTGAQGYELVSGVRHTHQPASSVGGNYALLTTLSSLRASDGTR